MPHTHVRYPHIVKAPTIYMIFGRLLSRWDASTADTCGARDHIGMSPRAAVAAIISTLAANNLFKTRKDGIN